MNPSLRASSPLSISPPLHYPLVRVTYTIRWRQRGSQDLQSSRFPRRCVVMGFALRRVPCHWYHNDKLRSLERKLKHVRTAYWVQGETANRHKKEFSNRNGTKLGRLPSKRSNLGPFIQYFTAGEMKKPRFQVTSNVRLNAKRQTFLPPYIGLHLRILFVRSPKRRRS
jgi:hypothetical protein